MIVEEYRLLRRLALADTSKDPEDPELFKDVQQYIGRLKVAEWSVSILPLIHVN